MTGAGEGSAQGVYRLGVGIMLLNRHGLVFGGRRIDTTGSVWQMPQGGIEQGETPGAAARRELKEETGIHEAEFLAESRHWLSYDLPPEIAAKIWGGRYRGQRQKWFCARFLGADGDIDLETHHPEFADWKWLEPADLPRFIVPFKRRLYLDVLAEFRDLLKG